MVKNVSKVHVHAPRVLQYQVGVIPFSLFEALLVVAGTEPTISICLMSRAFPGENPGTKRLETE